MEELMGMDEGLYWSYWDEDTMDSRSHNWKTFSYDQWSQELLTCATYKNFGLSFATNLK